MLFQPASWKFAPVFPGGQIQMYVSPNLRHDFAAVHGFSQRPPIKNES